MGTWGALPFENDAALDWLAELERRGTAAIDEALGDVTGRDAADSDEASEAVAAAATVAAAVESGYAGRLPDEVRAWLAERGAEITPALVDKAVQALESVTNSELSELWDESADLQAWIDSIDAVRAVLQRHRVRFG